jgi:hypothetical protein
MAPEAVIEMTDEEFELETPASHPARIRPGGLARFIRAHHSVGGDYTAERQKRQEENPQSLDEIWRDLEAKGLTQK